MEKEMATHSSTLAWKIPWMEEPGRLQSMGSQRIGHDWAISTSLVHSLSILFSRFIHVIVCVCTPFLFYDWIIFHYIDINVYLVISWWTFQFSLFGYYKYWCSEYHVQIFIWMYVFIFLGCLLCSGISKLYGKSIVVCVCVKSILNLLRFSRMSVPFTF